MLGFPFDWFVPKLLPMNDDDPVRPQLSYAFSKAVTETLAELMHRRYGMTFIGLRLSNIYYNLTGHPTGYDTIPPHWANLKAKMANLWAYVDACDVAKAVHLALAAEFSGAAHMTIAAADTIMRQTNEELLAATFPRMQMRPATGQHETLISIDKARRLLGYEPDHSWRDIIADPGSG